MKALTRSFLYSLVPLALFYCHTRSLWLFLIWTPEQWGPNQAVPCERQPLKYSYVCITPQRHLSILYIPARTVLGPQHYIYNFLWLLRGIAAATKYMLGCGVFHASVAKLVTQAT